jgi:hypothetical protein
MQDLAPLRERISYSVHDLKAQTFLQVYISKYGRLAKIRLSLQATVD